MRYSDPSEQRRQNLMQALLGHSPATGGGAAPLFGGSGRSFAGGLELPAAALPALTFNPFFAQLNQGFQHLAPPSNVTLPNPAQPQQTQVPVNDPYTPGQSQSAPGAGATQNVPGGPPAQVSSSDVYTPPTASAGVPDPTYAYNPNDVMIQQLFGLGSPSYPNMPNPNFTQPILRGTRGGGATAN